MGYIMGKLKKTFELDESVVTIIKEVADYSSIPECDVIEMAFVNPKVLMNTIKIIKMLKS